MKLFKVTTLTALMMLGQLSYSTSSEPESSKLELVTKLSELMNLQKHSNRIQKVIMAYDFSHVSAAFPYSFDKEVEQGIEKAKVDFSTWSEDYLFNETKKRMENLSVGDLKALISVYEEDEMRLFVAVSEAVQEMSDETVLANSRDVFENREAKNYNAAIQSAQGLKKVMSCYHLAEIGGSMTPGLFENFLFIKILSQILGATLKGVELNEKSHEEKKFIKKVLTLKTKSFEMLRTARSLIFLVSFLEKKKSIEDLPRVLSAFKTSEMNKLLSIRNEAIDVLHKRTANHVVSSFDFS